MNNSDQNRLGVLLIAIVIGAFIIIIGGYWILKERPESVPTKKEAAKAELPRMANLPPKKSLTTPPPPPTYAPDAPVLEKARKALREGITPEQALALAKSLPTSPERADAAFLLLEYAADSGKAEAALAVARYYDPTDDGPSGTIRKNPETAYEWYTAALKGGQDEAENHLAHLRQWVQKKAQQGSRKAQELLNHWRNNHK